MPLLFAAMVAAPDVHALNNCSGFSDLRGRANVDINSIVGQNRYSPSCVRITIGSSVTFNANFGAHPMYGGTVAGGVASIDPLSPIGGHNNGSVPVVVTFTSLGEFPYFCDLHYDQGMMGSVWVDPSLFETGFE